MKNLLTVSAVIECAAGAGALVLPSFAVEILLGTPLDAPVARLIARVAGAALIALGLMCWGARSEAGGRTARGVALAMTFYNISVTGLLVYAGLGAVLSGLGLWPAVIIHVAMTAWCVAAIRKHRMPGPIEPASCQMR